MKKNSADKVIITDVTLREYGQNVPAKYLPIFSAELRIETVLKLIDAGFSNIDIFSYVPPKNSSDHEHPSFKKDSERPGANKRG